MRGIRKRSVPGRWDERRERASARSDAYWQGRRDAAAGDCVSEVAVAWDRLRSVLRSLDRAADNRVARARSDKDSREAARKREQAVRLIGETCARAVSCLDSLTADVREKS